MHRRIIGSSTTSQQRANKNALRRCGKRDKLRSWCRPEIVLLEDRTLPSTLSFSGSNLSLIGFGIGTANNVSLKVVDANYEFNDTEENIFFGAGVPDTWSGNGTKTVTGPVASVTSIVVNGTSDNVTPDAFSIPAESGPVIVPGAVSVARFSTIDVGKSLTTNTGGNVTLNANATPASTLNVAAPINSDGVIRLMGRTSITVTASASLATTDKNIILTANDVFLSGTINSGTAPTGVTPFTAAQETNVGNDDAGKLGISDAELDLISAGLVRVGDASTTGNISVTAAISSPSWNSLSLRTTGTITQTAGSSLVLPNLAVRGNGGVTLTNAANNVTTLACSTVGTAFSFNDASGLALGIVDGVSGITTNGGNVTLTVQAGNLNLNAPLSAGTGTVQLTVTIGSILDDDVNGTVITAGTANLSAGGAIGAVGGTGQIDTTINSLTAAAGGGVYIGETNALTLTSVTAAASGNPNDVEITNAAGNIVVGSISAPGVVKLTAVGSILDDDVNGTRITSASANLSAGAVIGAIGATGQIDTTINNLTAAAGGGGVYVGETNAVTLISVTAAASGNTNDVEITNAAGNIVVGSISAPGAVKLTAVGSILDDNVNGTRITSASANLSAGGAIGAVGGTGQIDTTINNLTAAAGGGGVYVGETNAVTLTSVTAAASGNSNDVEITNAAGNIVVGSISAPGIVKLTAVGSILDDGVNATVITAGAANLTAGGSIGEDGDTAQIDTAIDSLTALASNGGVYIGETAGVSLTSVTATGGTGDGNDVEVRSGASGIGGANGDIIVFTVTAPDRVELTVEAGSILDDDDNLTVVTAMRAILTAEAAIGVPGDVGQLDTNFVRLQASAGSAGVFITETDDLIVGLELGAIGIKTIDGPVTLTVGPIVTGALAIEQPIDAGLGLVILEASDGITQTDPGIIKAAKLLLLGTGDFVLSLINNNVNTITANITGSLVFQDKDDLTVGTADYNLVTYRGIVSNGNNVTLCSDTGNLLFNEKIDAGTKIVRLQAAESVIQQTSNAVITADALGIVAGADVSLGAFVANEIQSTVAANAGGSLLFQNAGSFTIGEVVMADCFPGAKGFTSGGGGGGGGGGDVTICVATGDILIDQEINAGDGTVRLEATLGSVKAISEFAEITAAALGVVAGTNIELDFVPNKLFATLTELPIFAAKAGGFVRFWNTGAFKIGLVGAAACFSGATGIDSGGNVTICSEDGELVLEEAIVGLIVRIQVGGFVQQETDGKITASQLGVNAVLFIDLHQAENEIGVFAAKTTTIPAGAYIRFLEKDGFTVGDVADDGGCFEETIVGVTTNQSNITMKNLDGPQVLDSPVNAAPAAVRLTSVQGSISQFNDGIITAGTLGVIAKDDITLDLVNVVAVETSPGVVEPGVFAALITTPSNPPPFPAVFFRNAEGLIIDTVKDNGYFMMDIFGVKTDNGNLTLFVGKQLTVKKNIELGTGIATMTFNTSQQENIEAAFNDVGIIASKAKIIGSDSKTDILSMNYPSGTVFIINGANQSGVTQGNVDDLGGKIQVPTNLEFERIETFNGDAGADTFTVTVTTVGCTTTLNGKGGNDVFNLGAPPANTLDNLLGPIVINGGLEAANPTITPSCITPISPLKVGDTLNINDQGDGTANTYLLNSGSFQRSAIALVTFNQIETVRLNTGTGANVVTVTGTNNSTATYVQLATSPQNTVTIKSTGSGSYVEVKGAGGPDTITVEATGSNSVTAVAGFAGENVFNVGNGTLTNVLGNVCVDGTGGATKQQSPFTVSAGCINCGSCKDQSNAVLAGQQLIVDDQNHTDTSKYFARDTTIYREGTAVVYFKAMNTIDLKAGDGKNTIKLYDTAPSVTTHVIGGDSVDTVLVYDTGEFSNTEIKTGIGFDVVTIEDTKDTSPPEPAEGTGANSITIVRGEKGDDNLTMKKNGENSGVQLGGGNGMDKLFADMNQSGAMSTVLLKGGDKDDTFTVKFNEGGQPGGTIGVEGDGGNDQLIFENFDKLPEPSRINPGAPGSGTVESKGIVVLCYRGIERIPETAFQAASFLLPENNPTSGKPEIGVVFTGNKAVDRGSINSTPFAPIIAQPNPTSPFGFSAPTLAIGDVNQDGIKDLIVAMGSGYAPLVTVFDGASIFIASSASTPKIIAEFFAFNSDFAGGVYVAAGNLDGKSDTGILGQPHIVAGAGRGEDPSATQLNVFKFNGTYDKNKFPGGGVTLLPGYINDPVYPNFAGGVRVAVGPVNSTGFDDIITGAGPGGGPHVKVYDGMSKAVIGSFMAYDNFSGGVFVAAGLNPAVDTNADVMTAPGFGGTPHIKIFDGAHLPNLITEFVPQTTAPPGGIIGGVDPEQAGLSGVAFGSVGSAAGQTFGVLVGSGLGQPAELRSVDHVNGMVDDITKETKLITDTYFTYNKVTDTIGFAEAFGPNVLLSGVNVAAVFI